MTTCTRTRRAGALVIALSAAATSVASPEQPPAESRPGRMGGAGTMMESCQQMMAERRKTQQEMGAMNQRVEVLLQKAKEARGQQKVEALTAVVEELVAQRGRMVPMVMQSSQPMMEHMMQHMRMGMMQGMEQAMSCPMVQSGAGDEPPADAGEISPRDDTEESHTEHHPEN